MKSKKTKNLLITGGTSGIGLEIIRKLADQNFNILTCARSKKKLSQIKKKFKEIKIFKCDVSKESNVKELFNFSKKNFKSIDIIINAAGIYGEIEKIENSNFKRWKEAIEVNFFWNIFDM